MELQWRDAKPTAGERKAHEERGGVWLRKSGDRGVEPVYYYGQARGWCRMYSAGEPNPNPMGWAPVGRDFQAVAWPEVKPEWVLDVECAIGLVLHMGPRGWQAAPHAGMGPDLFWSATRLSTGTILLAIRNAKEKVFASFSFEPGENIPVELARRLMVASATVRAVV